MAKIRITESELRNLIRESIENIFEQGTGDGQGWKGAAPSWNGNYAPSPSPVGDGVKDPQGAVNTRTQAKPEQTAPVSRKPATVGRDGKYTDALDQDTHERDVATQNAVNAWNSLGTVGQLKKIQAAVGLTGTEVDGRIGPQTLARIFIKIGNGQVVGGIDTKALGNVVFNYGKKGTYTNRIAPPVIGG